MNAKLCFADHSPKEKFEFIDFNVCAYAMKQQFSCLSGSTQQNSFEVCRMCVVCSLYPFSINYPVYLIMSVQIVVMLVRNNRKNSEERRSSLFQSQCSKEAIAVIWRSETDNFVDCGDFLKPKLYLSTLKGTQTESTDINFFFVQKSVTIMRKFGKSWHCRKQSEWILTNVLVISHLQGITFCVKDVMKAERPGKTILRFPKLS